MTVQKTLQDAAYVAVGVAVLGAQRVQVRRREMTSQLQSFGTDAKNRIEPVITRVSEPAKAATATAKDHIARLPETATEVGGQLSGQIAELPNVMISATDRIGDAQTRVKSLLDKAMAEGKARIGRPEPKKTTTPYTATHNATTDDGMLPNN